MSDFVASVVALGLLYVAWQQWKTNRTKLNFALFDKKYKVYVAVRDFIIMNGTRKHFSKDDFDSAACKYIRATSSAPFLLGPAV